MATPYSEILKKFRDNVPEEDANKLELFAQRQFLRNAISMYIGTIGTVTPNNDEQQLQEDLSEVEMLLISLLMYDSYLQQEIIRYNKVINISNEFMKMTGATLRVKTLKDLKIENKIKIDNIVTSLI